jgi:hypothetical protein
VQYQPVPKRPEAIAANWATVPHQAEPTALELTVQLLPPAYLRSGEGVAGREAWLTASEGE